MIFILLVMANYLTLLLPIDTSKSKGMDTILLDQDSFKSKIKEIGAYDFWATQGIDGGGNLFFKQQAAIQNLYGSREFALHILGYVQAMADLEDSPIIRPKTIKSNTYHYNEIDDLVKSVKEDFPKPEQIAYHLTNRSEISKTGSLYLIQAVAGREVVVGSHMISLYEKYGEKLNLESIMYDDKNAEKITIVMK